MMYQNKEYLFCVCVEFAGLSFFSMLLGILNPLFKADETFKTQVSNKFGELDLWMQKIEKCVEGKFLHCGLYNTVLRTVEVAMEYDFNMIIEEFTFYSQLSPRLQTQMVDKIFEEFMEKFDGFFKHCQIGFRNEFVVSMLCRLFNKE